MGKGGEAQWELKPASPLMPSAGRLTDQSPSKGGPQVYLVSADASTAERGLMKGQQPLGQQPPKARLAHLLKARLFLPFMWTARPCEQVLPDTQRQSVAVVLQHIYTDGSELPSAGRLLPVAERGLCDMVRTEHADLCLPALVHTLRAAVDVPSPLFAASCLPTRACLRSTTSTIHTR